MSYISAVAHPAGPLLLEHLDLVQRAARFRRPNPQDRGDAEQDAAEAFLKYAGNYDPTRGVPLTRFLWPHLAHAAGRTVREYPLARRAAGQPTTWPVAEVPDAPDVEDDALDACSASLVRRFVAGLRPTDRYLVTRHYYQGAPLAQIARELGMAPQSVARRHARVLTAGRLQLAALHGAVAA